LSEEDTLVCDQTRVCEIFNDFFVHVAKNIGKNSINVNESHPSIQAIQNHIDEEDTFDFGPVDEKLVSKCIGKLGIRKMGSQQRL
jgi:hypothetical protein